MRLLLVDSIESTAEVFKAQEHFNVSYQKNLHLLSQLDINVLVVFERAININHLIEKKSYLVSVPFIFYVTEQENLDIEALCKANGIIIIQRPGNLNELVTMITECVIPINPTSKRLFLFLGTDHKTGTTTVVHSLAADLAKHTNKNIFVLSFNNQPNDEFTEGIRNSIDQLRPQIASKVVNFSELVKESTHVNGYYFLAGPRDMTAFHNYKFEDLVYLLEVLRQQEDFIVLVDGGADLNNKFVMAALDRIQNRIAVTTDETISYKRWKQKVKQVFEPGFNLKQESFMYILNGIDDELSDTVGIMKRYNSISLGTLLHSEMGRIAEEQMKPLSFIDQQYSQDINKISRIIATKADCSYQFENGKKDSIFGKLFSFGKVARTHGV